MSPFVADPDWGIWIILYFYLGGIAAGAYFLSSLIELVGGRLSRDLPRVGYWIAFPLIAICGLLLTVDLGHPERFWRVDTIRRIVSVAMACAYLFGTPQNLQS